MNTSCVPARNLPGGVGTVWSSGVTGGSHSDCSLDGGGVTVGVRGHGGGGRASWSGCSAAVAAWGTSSRCAGGPARGRRLAYGSGRRLARGRRLA